MFSRVLPLLALAALNVSCQARRVVSDRAFEYALYPDEAIIGELGANRALEVLRELGRIDEEAGRAELTDISGKTLTEIENTRPGFVSVTMQENGTRVTKDLPKKNGPPIVLSAGPYFSTMTAIAVEEGLDPTAIPGIAVGYRPDFSRTGLNGTWIAQSGIGFDLFLGGAVSPGGSSNGDTELALGLGATIPWSNSGAFSFGIATWSLERGVPPHEDTEIAAYFGVSLGNFNVSGNSSQ